MKKRIKKECIVCNKEYLVIPSRTNSKYCSIKCCKKDYERLRRRETSPNWKGGKSLFRCGKRIYVLIYNPDHPKARSGYVFEHRLVMEKHIRRYLTQDEVVHHKDRNTMNNKIENLELLSSKGKHMSIHLQGNKYFKGHNHTIETINKIKRTWKKKKIRILNE